MVNRRERIYSSLFGERTQAINSTFYCFPIKVVGGVAYFSSQNTNLFVQPAAVWKKKTKELVRDKPQWTGVYVVF